MEFGVWPVRITCLAQSSGIKQQGYSHEGIKLRPGQFQCSSPDMTHTSSGHRLHTGSDGAVPGSTHTEGDQKFTTELIFQPGVGVLGTAAASRTTGVKLLKT